MKPILIVATATVLTFAVAAPQGSIAHAQQAGTQIQQKKMPQMGGQMQKGGMPGPGGMMRPGGMKRHGGGMMGMMGKMRKKMMGKMFMVRQKPYSNADIKRMIDGRLAAHGFSRLIAGEVKDGSKETPKTAVVSVVSPKGELLFKVKVNRKSGMAVIIE